MGRTRKTDLPAFDEFMAPILQALLQLGGSGSIEEINQRVYETTKLTESQLAIPHGVDGRTEAEYRLAWARTYLKKAGLIENSSRGIWALTKADIDPTKVDIKEIIRTIKGSNYKNRPNENEKEETGQLELGIEAEQDWKEQLLNRIYQIPPPSFERLAQRILRESGFVQVEVTGQTGDGGIDGKGIVRISGFLSFHVIFQCKRWKGTIPPREIRDFRGAMQGRADKGLFITTGTFSRDAIKEATRDGAPPIDLIDGELLCDKLKEFRLGVETEMIERMTVREDWFNNL